MIQRSPSRTKMLQATMDCDASWDGLFYACVKTTGIFCRPSCPARKPKPENVEFRATVRECLLAGYRPCLRCRPLVERGDTPVWHDRLLARVETAPAARITDPDLRSMGIDPHAVRRYFQRNFGLTFHAYHRSRRMGLALKHIQAGGTDIEAAIDHGYESLSGFRDAFQKTFGVTPMTSKNLTCILTRTIDSPIGPLVACASDEGVCLLDFADRRALESQIETFKKRLNGVIIPGINQHLEQLSDEMSEYFFGERTTFTVPLVAPGTPFQEKVWAELARIPFAETRSYEQIAHSIGHPGAQRAIGRANGQNPIAIMVPCHRVIRSDGSLSGYGGGLWRKYYLLELERTGATPLATPDPSQLKRGSPAPIKIAAALSA